MDPRRSVLRVALGLVVAGAVLSGCAPGPKDTASDSGPDPDERLTDAFAIVFVDRAADLGLDFRHESGARGELWMPETLGSGVGLIDYDGDGDLDVYLVQGGRIDEPAEDNEFAAPTDRLFHNALSETGVLGFRDATEDAGLVYPRTAGRGYGQGVAVGDFDRDGDEDLFVTAFGPDRLLRNEGGVFSEVAGPWDDAGWSTSALFVDLRGDARPELFVARYFDYSRGTHKVCFTTLGKPDYCKPSSYSPLSDRLYEHSGPGWTDVSSEAGLTTQPTHGLGVLAVDVDLDGSLEILVANDQMANHLWTGTGRSWPLTDEGALAGVALNADGIAEGSMGIAAGDFDRDGHLDFLMTHLEGESHTLYRGLGGGLFDDASHRANLSTATLRATGFGVAAIDFDGDGWVDLAVANGKVHLDPTRNPTHGDDSANPLPLDEPDQLLRNESGRFRPVAARAFETSTVGRGMAVGDLDDDGDADLVFNDSEGPARVLINTLGQNSGWIGLALEDSAGLDPGEGVLVTVSMDGSMAGGFRQVRLRQRGGSYLSSNDPRVLFGLGDQEGPVHVTVRWPDGEAAETEAGAKEAGAIETFGPLAAGRYHRLRQGQGASP